MSSQFKVSRDLATAVTQGNEFLAQVRTATKDLRSAIKEAREVIELLQRAVQDQAGAEIETAVTQQMWALKEATATAIDEATAAVFNRFDRMTATLLGEDGQQEPLEGLLRRHIAARRVGIPGGVTVTLVNHHERTAE